MTTFGRHLWPVLLAVAPVAAQEFNPLHKPADVSAQWRAVIGEYVSSDDTVLVRERSGNLELRHSRGQFLAMKGLSDSVFVKAGTQAPDTVVVSGSKEMKGRLRWGGTSYVRSQLESESGSTFRIQPLRPVEELRTEALRATPPKESGEFLSSDLVEVMALDSTIKLDIRYATTNNFMRTQFYSMPKAFLQRPAAEALVRAHQWLKQFGYGIEIHDAYRPWYVTKMFWDATPDDKKIFVADPSKGSRHNRGCAADVTLYELSTGREAEMGSGYDEMSDRAYPGYPGGTSLQRWHRGLLRAAMERNDFRVYDWEWWHFDFKDWKNYPIGTKRFEELSGARC